MMKRVTLFVILFVLFSSSKAQNNSIKVSVFALGESFYTYSIWTAGITYERHLGKKLKTLENLTGMLILVLVLVMVKDIILHMSQNTEITKQESLL